MVAGVVDRHTTPRTSRMDSKDCQTLVVFLQILVLDQTQKDTRATISVTTPLNLGDSVVSAVDRSASKAASPPCPRCTDPGLRLLSLPPFTLLLWDTSSPCGFIFYSSQSSLCLPPPSGSSYVLCSRPLTARFLPASGPFSLAATHLYPSFLILGSSQSCSQQPHRERETILL